jgi:hypothetical protein
MKQKIVWNKTSIAALVFCVTCSCFGTNGPFIKVDPFPIFPWTMPEQTEKQLKQFKEANFTVVWLYPVNEVSYKQMKKYWDGNYIISAWWSKDSAQRMKNVEELLKFHAEDPKKIGYFIKDEPDINMIRDIKPLMDRYKKEDPNRIAMVNLYPSHAGQMRLGGSYQEYLETYFNLLEPTYCSFDHYPCYWFNMERKDYYYNIEQMYQIAAKRKSRMMGFVQVFSTPELRDVSESDIAWQVYSLLAYGCKGLWYFPYEPFEKVKVQKGAYDYSNYPVEMREYGKSVYNVGDSVIDRAGNPSYAFPYIKRINGEVLVWGTLLTNLNSTLVRHCGRSGLGEPVGTETFHPESSLKNPGEYITNVVASNPKDDMGFVVGLFEDESKRSYAMVVNKRHGENMTCKQGTIEAIITFRSTVKKAYSISNTTSNVEEMLEITNGKITVKIAGGSAILMRLEEK